MKKNEIYDDEKNGTCISGSVGSAKISSRKRSWHFVFIIFALALIFALLGLVDLKSNAAESQHSIEFIATQHYYLNDVLKEGSKYKYVVYGSSDMEVFYIQSHNDPTNTEDTFGIAFVVSEFPMTYSTYTYGSGNWYFDGEYESVKYELNGKTIYVRYVGHYFDGTGNGNYNGYVSLEFDYANCKQLARYYDTQEFVNAYFGDFLETKIDYDSLEVDSSLPLIENVLANKISNKTGVNSGGHSVSAVKEYYDYITWKNTGNYDIQVERYPIVKLYEGTFFPKFLEDFEGDFYLMEILSAGNSSFTYQVDLPYIESNYPNDYSFLGKITTDVAGFWDTCELYYGYRLRYVDGANNKASCWTYVIPEQSNIKWDYIEYPYYSYVEYVDGSLSDNSDATGSSGEYDSLDDIDNAKNELDNENAFKDKYDILVGDVGTQEVTNWLYSVVSFIKSTPSLVGSTLGFLPTPIRSGVFVVIFLGVVGSGLAIIRALI